MKTCLYCGFYKPAEGVDMGVCYVNPPVVMLIPVAPSKADAIASGGRAQGIAMQAVRATVQQGDIACRHFQEGKIG